MMWREIAELRNDRLLRHRRDRRQHHERKQRARVAAKRLSNTAIDREQAPELGVHDVVIGAIDQGAALESVEVDENVADRNLRIAAAGRVPVEVDGALCRARARLRWPVRQIVGDARVRHLQGRDDRARVGVTIVRHDVRERGA